MLEIIPDQITVLSTGNPLTTPATFNELDESTEGSHIALVQFTIDSIVPDLGGMNVYVTDELGNDVLIRVDAQSGITAQDLAGANAVRGIGSQFDSSFPYTSGYQIFALEFAIVNRVPVIAQDAILMQPNPASDMISLQSDTAIDAVEIYSMDGRLMMEHKVISQNVQVNVSVLHNGMYIVKALVKDGIWTSLLTVIR